MGRTLDFPHAKAVGRLAARFAASPCILVIAIAASAVVGCDGPGGRTGTPPAVGTDGALVPTADGAVPDAPVVQPTVNKMSRENLDVP